MSRRKQSRPIRHLEDESSPKPAVLIANPGKNTECNETHHAIPNEEPRIVTPQPVEEFPKEEPTNALNLQSYQELMCPRCQEQFTDVDEFLLHKQECSEKAKKHDEPAHSDPEDMVVSEDDDEESEDKSDERMMRYKQDAANNNSLAEQSSEAEDTPRLPDFPFPVPVPGHVTLEALEHTKVAVAQFAAKAMANSGDENAMQELAVLQNTLFTLQHQQVLQLQLINQLQQQLSINRPDAPRSPGSTNENEPAEEKTPEPSPTVIVPPAEPSPIIAPPTIQPKIEPLLPTTVPSTPSISMMQPHMQPLCGISSAFASTIITHDDPHSSLDEPNTLEVLQKRAQEVLDNASQGLLATNLADELAFRKSKGSMSPFDPKGRNEPFFKHRCRYCGKVFGSDSALQIHIRSHTGERPYKCNVCGSRFTTKGNLKVHFQRHSQKFPHIKMNPNPVPEHLDKFHPPLLATLPQSAALSPVGPPPPPHMGFPGGHPFPTALPPLYRPAAPVANEVMGTRLQPSPSHRPPEPSRLFPSHQLFINRQEQELPENLSKPVRSPSPPREAERLPEPVKEEPQINQPITPKQEIDTDNEQQERERFNTPGPYDDCSGDSSNSNEETLGQRISPTMEAHSIQEEPENLSQKGNSMGPLNVLTGQRLPGLFTFGHAATSPQSSASSGSLGHYPSTPLADPARDPAIYTNLLPRPGSNDNSWESLIEVTKPSETSKLQQLVDNIEHKLSDPNQCVICHRVLSCKSALQMHYRTHTGERPFKCKICGRAFTTKGNLKTHMGVHRAKPPMRVLHQCPVCHKKFTNALVLQQHIRLHTGEPTDLTPEQIQAAEVRDFPSPGGFPQLPNSMNPFLNQTFHVPGMSPLGQGFPMNMKMEMDRDVKSEIDYMDDDDDDDDMSNSEHMAFSSASPLDHHQNSMVNTTVQKMMQQSTSCTPEDFSNRNRVSPMMNGLTPPPATASPGAAENLPSPTDMSNTVQVKRPSTPEPAASPNPSESNSLGALDLTPKTSQAPISSSPGPNPCPPSIFTSFGLMHPGPPSRESLMNTSPLMTSALSSLTSSVLTSTSFSPLRLAVGPGIRGNTTCNLCFKTFACNSALEIHYRSHTKERPFKCTVCDRGFSTKGNMKQHMLTHKIRDMPQHMFEKPLGGEGPPQQHPQQPLPQQQPQQQESSQPNHQPPTHSPQMQPIPKEIKTENEPTPTVSTAQNNHHSEPPMESPTKRPPPPEIDLPPAKRPPSLQAKHLCHVCNKNFSSSSALQIHMRTHTGDKPFRCTVCQKAFTTKGNLKVHMGTHMWSNGASRRGRRMSLDLPPIPMSPKDSEFLQRRPELFYPYLPAPFLNGMQQKLNDITMVQNQQNGLSGAGGGKFNLLGFGYPPTEVLRSQTSSPERPPSRPASRSDPERLWDLHFDRKPSVEPSREDHLPTGREGLAA